MNRDIFFNTVRQTVFNGSMNQQQVNGLNTILDEWVRRKWTDLRFLAYILATVYWETAHTMQPIAEYGKGKGRKYGVRGKYGQVPYGRGYVQLTWDYNYEKADNELGLKGALLRNFELAMRPDIAVQILFVGMLQGWFTKKSLSTYFNNTITDWYNARRIINGTDKAVTIGNIAKNIHRALLLAADGTVKTPKPVAEPVKPPIVVPHREKEMMTPAQQGTGLGVVIVAIMGFVWAVWDSITTWVGCLFSSAC